MPKSTTKTTKKKVVAKPSVKPVTKKVTKSAGRVKSAATSSKSTSWWDTYCAERDTFYRNHPNSQLLLAVLILVILVYVGVYFWSQSMALPIM